MAADAGMFTVRHTRGTVLCCKCGILMEPNAANMCVNCLRSEVDITEDLQKHVIIMYCPDCESYLQPPRTWVKAQLESRELLTFCIKRLKNINKVKLIDARFIWTEPHSKRILVELCIQRAVMNGGVILEQKYRVEYVVQDHMCESCSRVQANPDQWVASVQLRQHVSHRRTFFYLEQLILKHDAAVRAIKIKQMEQGIDFFFANRSHAVKFIEFLGKVTPIKSRHDKQLVSHDRKSNNYNYKYTFSVEICPVCREDLICLPPKVKNSLGNIGPIVICTKVTNSVALLDPVTLRQCYLDADQYWRYSFKSLLSSRQLIEYIVLNIVPTGATVPGTGYALAHAEVARVSDFGYNDTMFTITTHLGHLLNPGDYALGYDLYGANHNDMELEKYNGLDLPYAILIKKSYEEKRRQSKVKPRSWKLKNLDMEVDDATRAKLDQEKVSTEYEQFLRDLEENPELRFNISLYRDKELQASEMAASTNDGDEPPSVPLEELLADLEISDDESEEDESSMKE
uniref:60S ribosomal export protein NMD3 n=1 Tax=Kalanchoe fedtschenkoi TaxID=63787 RepID=A0A7N0TBQ1_KALFE